MFGSRNTVMATIRDNLLLMESRLPRNMLHPAWPQHRAEWEELVEASATPANFANVLSRLELVIKPVVFTHAWREALGEYFHKPAILQVSIVCSFPRSLATEAQYAGRARGAAQARS